MTLCEQYIANLAEAQSALHRLTIGGKVESVQDGEHRIAFTKADSAALRTYIDELQAKVDACNGLRPNPRRIMHILPIG